MCRVEFIDNFIKSCYSEGTNGSQLHRVASKFLFNYLKIITNCFGRLGDYFFVPLSLCFTYISIVTINAATFMITINSS